MLLFFKLHFYFLLFLLIFVEFLFSLKTISTNYANTKSYNGLKRNNLSLYEPLLKYILQGYNRLAIPICQKDKPIAIFLDMWLYQLFDLDMPKQILTIDVWIDLTWHDCSIFWEPKWFNGIEDIVLPTNIIWYPDIFIYQGLQGSTKEGLFVFKASSVKIGHKGHVQLGAQFLLKTFCRVNMLAFPYDEQMCPITFSAWNKDSTVFNMTKKPLHENDNGHSFKSASNGEWNVIGFRATDSFHVFQLDLSEEKREKFSEVTFTLHLKRKPKFIQMYLMFPCMLLLWITSITFLLPVKSGEKVSLISTILLSLIVFLLVVAGYVPDTSDSVSIIGKFYYIAIGLVVFAMIMTTIVLNVSHQDPNLHMPVCLKRLLFSKTARLFNVISCYFPVIQDNRMAINHSTIELSEPFLNDLSTFRSNPWEQLGLLLDRIFLLVYVIICTINTVYVVNIEWIIA